MTYGVSIEAFAKVCPDCAAGFTDVGYPVTSVDEIRKGWVSSFWAGSFKCRSCGVEIGEDAHWAVAECCLPERIRPNGCACGKQPR